MEMETKIDTSAILLLSPPLAKAAAVFFTAAAFLTKLMRLTSLRWQKLSRTQV
jgi:hypothetical protein